MRWRRLWLLAAGLTSGAAAALGLSDDRGRRVELVQPAQRIVSLVPSLTETVCELQACGRLVGIDRHANWPAQIERLPRLGGMDDPQIERIVALKPDLVLVAVSTRAIDRLESLGLKVLALEPQTLQDTQRVMQTVASALGVPERAAAAWQRLEQRIAVAAARVPPQLRERSVYFEVASTPFAAGEASFIGEVLKRLGLHNIVPASLGAFPQLSPEFVVRAQPRLVMASATAVPEMGARPGWAVLRALNEGQTCALAAGPYDALMRPGPRLGEGAEAIADCLVALGKMPP